MKVGKTLYVKNRIEWRRWLRTNAATQSEVWLIFYKIGSGRPRITYNDAAEEALCFGWIDSILKKVDDKRFVQRFSIRRPGSIVSQMNKERIRKLIRQNRMTKRGLAAIAHAFDPKRDMNEVLHIPSYIERALKSNPRAWGYFRKFPDNYKRIRIAYIESRKRHGTSQVRKALKYFVEKTSENKRIGFVHE